MSQPKILMIDDDEDLVAATKAILGLKPYEFYSAGSGVEGIALAKKIKPSLILLDVMMESTSAGFEAARAIRQAEGLTNVPILMMTAIKDKMGFDFSKEAGDPNWLPVNDYVEKPLQPADLLAKVEKLLAL